MKWGMDQHGSIACMDKIEGENHIPSSQPNKSCNQKVTSELPRALADKARKLPLRFLAFHFGLRKFLSVPTIAVVEIDIPGNLFGIKCCRAYLTETPKISKSFSPSNLLSA